MRVCRAGQQTCPAALAAMGGSGGLGLGAAKGVHIHMPIEQAGSDPLNGLHPLPLVQLVLCLACNLPYIRSISFAVKDVDVPTLVDLITVCFIDL